MWKLIKLIFSKIISCLLSHQKKCSACTLSLFRSRLQILKALRDGWIISKTYFCGLSHGQKLFIMAKSSAKVIYRMLSVHLKSSKNQKKITMAESLEKIISWERSSRKKLFLESCVIGKNDLPRAECLLKKCINKPKLWNFKHTYGPKNHHLKKN